MNIAWVNQINTDHLWGAVVAETAVEMLHTHRTKVKHMYSDDNWAYVKLYFKTTGKMVTFSILDERANITLSDTKYLPNCQWVIEKWVVDMRDDFMAVTHRACEMAEYRPPSRLRLLTQNFFETLLKRF